MAPNLCRCGTQMRILRAVHRAARLMTVELAPPVTETRT
jgi:aerobic-type carbon monoxide dehydrogenase small subunit (CoxS/CutS family)